MEKLSFYICGGGKIADNEINSYADKIKPIEVDGQYGYPVQYVPKKMFLSKEIGKTFMTLPPTLILKANNLFCSSSSN